MRTIVLAGSTFIYLDSRCEGSALEAACFTLTADTDVIANTFSGKFLRSEDVDPTIEYVIERKYLHSAEIKTREENQNNT